MHVALYLVYVDGQQPRTGWAMSYVLDFRCVGATALQRAPCALFEHFLHVACAPFAPVVGWSRACRMLTAQRVLVAHLMCNAGAPLARWICAMCALVARVSRAEWAGYALAGCLSSVARSFGPTLVLRARVECALVARWWHAGGKQAPVMCWLMWVGSRSVRFARALLARCSRAARALPAHCSRAACALVACWLRAGCMLVACRLHSGCLLAASWLHDDCMLAA